MCKSIRRALYAPAVFCLLSLPILAQTETGQINGTVTDQTGGVVTNANVVLTGIGTGVTRTTKTNQAGIYAFANLLPGDYQVKADAPGFSTASARVSVTVGAKVERDIKLEVGKTQTVVEVTESPVQVDTETQTLSTTVTTRQILEMPTLTRNPYALVAVSGNVSEADPTGRGAGFAISGLRSESTNVLLDGAANNDEFVAAYGQRVPLDAVQEFSVLTTNFGPEYGRAGAGVVNLATKSGTNEFHGTAYEFNRLSALASNDFNSNANGLDRPIYTRNQFGYSLGGPAVKNKLFFFNSTEWTRVRSSANVINYVFDPGLISLAPSNVQDVYSKLGALRDGVQVLGTYTKGDLAAQGLNVCAGGSATGPCAQLPSTTTLFDRVAYTVPQDSGAGSPQNTYFGVARVDYNLSEKTLMYGRYAYEKEFDLLGTNGYSPYKGFDTNNINFNNNILWSVVHTFSPRFVSQSKIVFNRLNNTQPLGDFPPVPSLYFAKNNAASTILGDNLAMPGYLPFSPGNAIPFGGPQNFAELYQDLSYNVGRHQLRFGGSYEYIRDNRTFGAYEEPVVQLGRNNGTAFDDLLIGQESIRATVLPRLPAQSACLWGSPASAAQTGTTSGRSTSVTRGK
jgi:hypothetical protein